LSPTGVEKFPWEILLENLADNLTNENHGVDLNMRTIKLNLTLEVWEKVALFQPVDPWAEVIRILEGEASRLKCASINSHVLSGVNHGGHCEIEVIHHD
jgi:hypothetical protein